MILRVLNSGSLGNCYLFEAKDSTLIVECGVPFKEVKAALNFNVSQVCGAIVTHEHGDHSKGILETLRAGIDVYASSGTIGAIGLKSHRLKTVTNGQVFNVGPFKIKAFDVKHDCKEPFGFLIHHPECGNVLFLTDTYYVPYKFRNLNNILVEANYCQKIVDQRTANGSLVGVVKDRVLESHMSIDTCIDLLKANDLRQVNNIVLIHLSDGNSNEKEFKSKVMKATGKNVHVASKGMKIPLNKTAV